MSISRVFPVFSIAFAVIYLASVQYNLALFTYHPETAQWGPLVQAPKQGPAMYWYGWTATTLIVAPLIGFLATLLPESMAKKIPLILVWLLPILAVPYLIWDLRQWWFR